MRTTTPSEPRSLPSMLEMVVRRDDGGGGCASPRLGSLSSALTELLRLPPDKSALKGMFSLEEA